MSSYYSESSDEDSNDDDLAISETVEIKELYILVAAVDFGTTFSGYAFSMKNKPRDIHMNKSWGLNLGFQSYKTPTSVLVGPDGEFKAFGHEAEQMYSELVEEGGAGGHELYRHFKMMLHKDGVTRRSKIKSVSGVLCNAMDIFAMSLRYLKDHMLTAVTKQIATSIADEHIKWVITVPVIWTDEAKQFTREAACKAGIIQSPNSRQLSIALEPETASVYCQSLDIEHFVCGGNIKSVSFTPGTKYMVIDAGGGTIDITAYKVLASERLKELYAANGGPWGGTEVDNNFIKLLTETLGMRFVDFYQTTCPKQWLTLMTNFENSKKYVKTGESSKIVMPLSWSMGEKFREVMGGKNIEQAIQETSRSDVKFANGALVFGPRAVASLFEPVIDKIVEHLGGIIGEPKLRGCKYILLVGGFGECSFLQDAIIERVPDIKVLVPYEAQMSVIKGAVLFGHNPSTIYSRIARKTYGIKVCPKFIEGTHDPQNKVTADGKHRCEKVFRALVQQGDEIKTGQLIKITGTATKRDQVTMSIAVYTLDRQASLDEPEYVDGPGFTQVGSFHVDMPDMTLGRKRKVDIQVSFGETEIHVFGRDATSGCVANITIDFLSD